MQFTTRTIIFTAMVLLTIVSMWTTYMSLNDSILPEPDIDIPLPNGIVWECSIFALMLSVAIGLMLFGLKVAIIDGQKRLNIIGVIGMTVIAFISISFNLDVLYRIADREFFIRYSTARVKSVYEDYLAAVKGKLIQEQRELRKQVAQQEGELESEIKGLRQAPQGYGRIARQEEYELTLLQKTAEVDIQTIEQALATEASAEELLRAARPTTLDEIQHMQDQLRVAVTEIGAVAGLPLPEVVELQSPLFTVFAKLFDFETLGMKEIFLLAIAFFLDLGDIIGYSMVPNKKRKPAAGMIEDLRGLGTPEVIPPPAAAGLQIEDQRIGGDVALLEEPSSATAPRHPRRPVRFSRRN